MTDHHLTSNVTNLTKDKDNICDTLISHALLSITSSLCQQWWNRGNRHSRSIFYDGFQGEHDFGIDFMNMTASTLD